MAAVMAPPAGECPAMRAICVSRFSHTPPGTIRETCRHAGQRIQKGRIDDIPADDIPVMTSGPVQIWVVSDGTAGMRLQAVALADALRRVHADWACEEFTVAPHEMIRALPRLAAWMPGLPLYAAAKTAGRGGQLHRRPHAGRFPNIMITCGRRMAGFALALRRHAHAADTPMQIVHIQDPRLPPRLFDALVVPRHDRARGPNVLVTTGSLNRLTLASIQQAMMAMPSRWLGATRRTAVAVMLGGDNRRYRVSDAMTAAMGTRLAGFATANDAQLIIVASRRTPDGLVARITAELPADMVMLPRDDEPNIYPGILGLAQATIVTADSVNMASEAAISGRPVMIAPWRAATPDNPSGECGRIRAFHDAMFAAGHTVPLGATIPSGPFERLDEMDGLATELLALLGRQVTGAVL
ncbi:MAG: mitochondrial fission ELM1 family protein [Pseudomonadota bacterium]|nr:mitochondrial fission ELM1 family protein [Pseudomonadota bacterium]